MRELKGDRRSRILAAMALLLGSLSFFMTLCGLTVYLGLTWGAIFQSKFFLIVLSVFLLLAAVAMLADWSMRLPQFIYRIPIRRYLGAYLTGALAGVLSTPCSGPFLGSVLAYALTRSPLVVLSIFSAIAAGLAAPYVLILVWPGMTERIRFSGAWTVQAKQFLGMVLLAGALFFGRVFLSPSIELILSRGLMAAILIWVLVTILRARQWSERLLPLIVTTSLFFLTLATTGDQLKWRPFSPIALNETLLAHQPVLLEFTAEWCLNCEVLEKTTYRDHKVIHAAKKGGVVPYRVDMTDYNAGHKALLEKYGGTALPFALLIAPDGNVKRRFTGMFSATALVQAIRDASNP